MKKRQEMRMDSFGSDNYESHNRKPERVAEEPESIACGNEYHSTPPALR